MSKAKRAKEWVKTALIVLLSASTLVLGWHTGLFNDVFRALPFFGNVAEVAVGTADSGFVDSAARPLVIVITHENGERFGIRYDTAMRNSVYDRTSGIMGEALGSASEVRQIDEARWRAALQGAGVYFEYIMPVRLSVLDGWLGVRLPDPEWDRSVRRIFVAFGEDTNRLYFQDADSLHFYGADTASSALRAQEVGMYDANGAVFAFETDIRAAHYAPYMLLMPGSRHPVIRAASTGGLLDKLDSVLLAFGMQAFPTHSYINDGVLVCVGAHFRVEVEPHGRVVYRRTDALPAEDAQLNDGEIIERARVITADTIGRTAGEAEVFFEMIQRTEDTVVVTFCYYIMGGRVHMYEDGFAARITFRAGLVTEAELIFRNFTRLDYETVMLLPEKQTLAAAGGEFMLSFSDTGLERLEPNWVKHSVESGDGL